MLGSAGRQTLRRHARSSRAACLRYNTNKSGGTDYESLVGPRDIFDEAHERAGVLSIPYESVVDLAAAMAKSPLKPGSIESVHPKLCSDDFVIISKILRRAPRPEEAEYADRRVELAQKMMRRAADMKNQSGMLFLAEEALNTKTTSKKDREAAMEMLRELAMQKVGQANFLLAHELQRLGREEAAMKAYKLAGEQDVAEGYTKLATILRYRGSVHKSKEAFQLAAEAGEPNAQFMMTLLEKDAPENLYYLQNAAAAGVEYAAHNLAEHYRIKGQDKLAIEYAEMAAEKGLQPSQVILAMLLVEQKRFDEAEKWLNRAIKAGGELGEGAKKSLDLMKNSEAYKNRSQGWCSIM